jgi:hypothetical protein
MLAIGYLNAVGHTRGARRFDNLGTDAVGFGQTLVALLLAGEPLGHNYHHRFPGSATVRPGRFDPGHWFATRILRGVPVRLPKEAIGAVGPRGGPLRGQPTATKPTRVSDSLRAW